MSSQSPAPRVKLIVRFDVNQLSSLLHYKLERERPPHGRGDEPDPEPRDGAYADSLHFNPGERLSLELVAYGDNNVLRVDVTDACFVTKPKVMVRSAQFSTRFSPPSMFGTGRAIQPLALDFSGATEPYGTDRSKTVLRWNDTLDIVDTGIWEVSFVLTVAIVRGDDILPELRVFSFDPESEVGGPSTIKVV
ncbi:hypothetical protein [Duganella violaceipulchra]|uniref:Inclusion body protein n=1 Tax=Duganella violaceipulchra TaxID=2849652 RepID=A0AA41H728_9BURK|nr:hypothetical protein [Duganella violaceicalia]MBV6320926.1 hypothetical protein [Duganella violaceicalia]MCP2008362.1 hypothetical protein [Duganella violaceicalia]